MIGSVVRTATDSGRLSAVASVFGLSTARLLGIISLKKMIAKSEASANRTAPDCPQDSILSIRNEQLELIAK